MSAIKRLFSEGFRAFFLFAAIFAVLSMIVWEGWIAIHAFGGMAELPAAPAPHLWHAHEMIFGYGAAALGGFFLTAVPNWTGAKGAPHLFIATVAGVWLAGRIVLWGSGHLPAGVVALIDLSFVPVLWAKILMLLLRRPKPAQMIFLVTLGLFWAANLMVHLEWLGLTQDTLWGGMRAGLLSLCAMIMILGGRITPSFTRNAMVQSGRETGLPANPMGLAVLANGAAMATVLIAFLPVSGAVWGAVALVAGGAGLARVAQWRGIWARGRPILWTMHLSYALNALGFMAFGLACLGLGSEVAALHLLGIGGVGGMTLAVMSRAALGHTGRALVAPRGVAFAYALLPLAALLRFAGSFWPALYYPFVLASGALWIVAFTLFLAEFWPVFWGPRLARAPAPRVPSNRHE